MGREFLAAEENGAKVKFRPYQLPEQLHVADIEKLTEAEEWLSRTSHKPQNRQTHNLYRYAIYLLRQPGASVLLERIPADDGDAAVVRFRKLNPLPEDKEVIVLDATANEELLRAVAPDWDFKVWDCPPIEQQGRVIQVMDYDMSRNRIKKEVQRHSPHNPSWLAQVVDHVLDRHGPAPIITFKHVVDRPTSYYDIVARLKHADKITEKYNFPCRGHNIDAYTLIVLGTPYKDQAAIWELAMAIWGLKGLPKTDYQHREIQNGYFVSKTMAYADPHLKDIEAFMVSAELVQAIGRARPLQNAATVFVISNARIPDWEVEQFTASELFDMRLPLRKDSAKVYQRFAQMVNGLLDGGDWVSFKDVLDILNMPRRTADRYWKRYRIDHDQQIEDKRGAIRRKSLPGSTALTGRADQ
jgi:hypothetical protein